MALRKRVLPSKTIKMPYFDIYIEIVFKNNIYPHGNIVSSLLLVEAYFYNNSTFINQWKALRLLP